MQTYLTANEIAKFPIERVYPKKKIDSVPHIALDKVHRKIVVGESYTAVITACDMNRREQIGDHYGRRVDYTTAAVAVSSDVPKSFYKMRTMWTLPQRGLVACDTTPNPVRVTNLITQESFVCQGVSHVHNLLFKDQGCINIVKVALDTHGFFLDRNAEWFVHRVSDRSRLGLVLDRGRYDGVYNGIPLFFGLSIRQALPFLKRCRYVFIPRIVKALYRTQFYIGRTPPRTLVFSADMDKSVLSSYQRTEYRRFLNKLDGTGSGA